MINDTLIKLDKIGSSDFYLLGASKIKAFLNDVTFEVKRGDAFGISSHKRAELECLTQIISNVRPYGQGKATLGKIGMMRKKNLILPHLFYVSAPDMLPEGYTALNFAVELYGKKHGSEKIAKIFKEFGVERLGAKYTDELTDNEKMLIEAVLANLDGSDIVVFNFTQSEFYTSEIEILSLIVKKTASQDRGVVVSSMQAKLIGICCDKVAYLVDGQVAYVGSVGYLMEKLDRVRLILVDDEAEQLCYRLREIFDDVEFKLEGNSIFVMSVWDKEFRTDIFLRKMAREKIEPSLIRLNKGRVQNSFEEITRTLGK